MTRAECRTLFVGAVEEGRRCLDAMLAWGERFVGIVTLKDDLVAATSGAVSFDDVAAAHGIPLLKVRNLNVEANVRRVRDLAPDLILVIGWTRLLGADLLRLPPIGCVGFHASLLPRYRGRAPVNWAIINGEPQTGNTMFFLDEGVDTGDIIDQRRIAIDYEDTCATLYRKVSDSAIDMLARNMPLLREGRAPRTPQDHGLATVMPKRAPEDGVVDWRRPRRALYDWVRALTHPYPGAFSRLDGRRLFIWASAEGGADPGPEEAGAILGIEGRAARVATPDGGLLLTRVQWEGGPEADGTALSSFVGRRFETPRRTS